MRGKSAAEAEAALRLAHRFLKFEIVERLPVENPVTRSIAANRNVALTFGSRRNIFRGQLGALAKEKLLHLLFHDFLRLRV